MYVPVIPRLGGGSLFFSPSFFWEGIETDLWATCKPQPGLLTVSATAIDHRPIPPPCSVASLAKDILQLFS